MNYSYIMVGIQLSSKVGEKGQIVIPKPIRDKFNIHSDTEIIFDIEQEKLILRKKESMKIFESFVNAVKNKKRLPKHVDWDEEYYSQRA